MKSILKAISLICLRPFSILVPKPHVAILMYHSVENSSWKYGVSPLEFEKQIAHICSNFKVRPLSEVVEFALGKRVLPHNTLAITIDDGYADTYEVVFPIVKKYGIHVTVFLTTNLNKLEKLGNLPRIGWPQVEEMYQSGLVSFEVHGREHLDLDQIKSDSKKLEEELIGCRNDIKNHTGYDSKIMAYAAGKKSPEVIEFIKNNGFIAACGIGEGVIRPGDQPFKLRRIQVDRSMPFYLFKQRITPAIDLYRKVISLLKVR